MTGNEDNESENTESHTSHIRLSAINMSNDIVFTFAGRNNHPTKLPKAEFRSNLRRDARKWLIDC